MNPIKIFGGSFGGPTLYENPFYVSPNQVIIDALSTENNSFSGMIPDLLMPGFSRFEHWRKGRRLESMQRRSKQRLGGKCMRYLILWNLMSLQICGKNNFTFAIIDMKELKNP